MVIQNHIGGEDVICSFIGHSKIVDARDLEIRLRKVLVEIIEEKEIDVFYLGGYGDFDMLCAKVISKLKEEYMHIKSYLILAYYSPKMNQQNAMLYDGTIYPNLEHIPKRFCILERNKWIINNSEIIISYVKYSFGGAYKTLELARKRNDVRIITLHTR